MTWLPQKTRIVDYLDLYLIHWPIEGRYTEAWKAMEKLYSDGRVKAIGVSNFHRQHLEEVKTPAQIILRWDIQMEQVRPRRRSLVRFL